MDPKIDRLFQDLVIVRDSSTPPHQQLRAYLQYMISTRSTPPGAALPSVRRLSELLGLARSTVQRAYDELQRRGLVETRRGAGTFVVDFDNEPTKLAHPVLLPYIDAAIAAAERSNVPAVDLERMVAARVRHLTRRPTARVTVTYVDEHAYLLRMAQFLRKSLSDPALDVLPVHLENFRINGLSALAYAAAEADLVVCAPYVFGYVRRALPDRQDDIVGITLTLHPDTLVQLRALEPSSVIGVVASRPEFLSFAAAVVKANVVADHEPTTASTGDQPSFRRLLDRSNVIVFHAGSREELVGQIKPGTTAIELVHIPDPASVERLKARLKTKLAERQFEEDWRAPH